MAYRVDLTPRAQRDLTILYDSIHAEGSPAAARWFNGLEALLYQLEEYPLLGFAAREQANIRQLIYGKRPHLYRILYKVDAESDIVTVLHIRHGRQRSFTSESLSGHPERGEE